jgi:hypothetical protein
MRHHTSRTGPHPLRDLHPYGIQSPTGTRPLRESFPRGKTSPAGSHPMRDRIPCGTLSPGGEDPMRDAARSSPDPLPAPAHLWAPGRAYRHEIDRSPAACSPSVRSTASCTYRDIPSCISSVSLPAHRCISVIFSCSVRHLGLCISAYFPAAYVRLSTLH